MSEMTAPDRIWAQPDYTDHENGTWSFGDFTDYKPQDERGTQEYIRADLNAALQAENERLRRALEDIADQHCPSEPVTWSGTEYDWVMRQYGKLRSLAQSALK